MDRWSSRPNDTAKRVVNTPAVAIQSRCRVRRTERAGQRLTVPFSTKSHATPRPMDSERMLHCLALTESRQQHECSACGAPCGLVQGLRADGPSGAAAAALLKVLAVAMEAVVGEEARACGGSAVLVSASGGRGLFAAAVVALVEALAVPRRHCCWKRSRCPCR